MNITNNVMKKICPIILTITIFNSSLISSSPLTAAALPIKASTQANDAKQCAPATIPKASTARIWSAVNSGDAEITPTQADKMALALTDKIWVWDWVAFFVPYMSKKGVKKLLPASKQSEWAGWTDMETGKKLAFTKKQINAARKHKPAQALTRKDIDGHALLIMQSNGDWGCISFMLPYMTRKGIRSVVRCYNKKHGDDKKQAADYYSLILEP